MAVAFNPRGKLVAQRDFRYEVTAALALRVDKCGQKIDRSMENPTEILNVFPSGTIMSGLSVAVQFCVSAGTRPGEVAAEVAACSLSPRLSLC